MGMTKKGEALKHTWNLRGSVRYLEEVAKSHYDHMTDLEKGAVKEILCGAYNQLSRLAELYGSEEMVEMLLADMMAVSKM